MYVLPLLCAVCFLWSCLEPIPKPSRIVTIPANLVATERYWDNIVYGVPSDASNRLNFGDAGNPRAVGNPGEPTDLVEQLVAASKRGQTLWSYAALKNKKLSPSDLKKALAFISTHKNSESYHLLFSVRKDYPTEYKEIPKADRAAILCSGLKNVRVVTDWGMLDGQKPTTTPGFSDPAVALIELGKEALPCLTLMLTDKKAAQVEGFGAATISEKLNYRRCDYAHQFISFILDIPYELRESIEERDKAITQLSEKLKESTKKR